MAINWHGTADIFEVGVKADVTGASEGCEASAKYAYRLQWGNTMVTPNVGVSYVSKKLANYYFGTLGEEVA